MSVTARVRALTAGFVLSLGLAAVAHAHSAHVHDGAGSAHHNKVAFVSRGGRSVWQHYGRHARFAGRSGHSGGRLQCVTFARMDSGIELSGNASAWWDNAAGIYQRGARPEPGSVLSFRSNGAMRLGHVAVVSDVVDSRTVAIDQANWGGPGQVTRDVTVVDVSPGNDWSAVRVGLGHTGEFGSIYPTNGFIYNRPDTGPLIASRTDGTPVPLLNPPPRDLRGGTPEADGYDEVAEAPEPGESHWHRRVSYRRPHHAAHRHHRA